MIAKIKRMETSAEKLINVTRKRIKTCHQSDCKRWAIAKDYRGKN